MSLSSLILVVWLFFNHLRVPLDPIANLKIVWRNQLDGMTENVWTDVNCGCIRSDWNGMMPRIQLRKLISDFILPTTSSLRLNRRYLDYIQISMKMLFLISIKKKIEQTFKNFPVRTRSEIIDWLFLIMLQKKN